MKVYWTSVEFDILIPSAYENCVGGFVYLFTKADDVRDAIVKFQNAIEEEDLRINHVEFVAPYEDTPWDTKEDQALYDAMAKEADTGEDVIWDEILAYESKDEQ